MGKDDFVYGKSETKLLVNMFWMWQKIFKETNVFSKQGVFVVVATVHWN